MRIRPSGLGVVHRRKDSPFWHIRFWYRNRCYRESSHSTVRSDALRLLRKRQAELASGRLMVDAEKITFDDLARLLQHDYEANGRRSVARMRQALAHLREFFEPCRAIEIASNADAYVAARLKAGAKPATIRLELGVLGRALTLAARSGLIAQRPKLPTIEVRNVRTGFFDESEVRAVGERLAPELRSLVLFAFFTGWRKSEVLSLQWRQVDFESGTVRLEPGSTKNDEGRTFPFAAHPELAALLRARRDELTAFERAMGRIVPWVFHRNGKPIRDFDDAWQRACREAGVPGRLFHDLRRSAVRNLERAGVPRSWAMKLTGHKTESVYRRYAIVSESDLFDGVQRLVAMAARTSR